MSKQPLAEVFGFPITNASTDASRYQANRLCPYNNKVPNCTKDKAEDPLGVCSLFEGDEPTIVCPVRFRQDWLITVDAARFFFPTDAKWTSLTEMRLNDKNGKSAGNIDIVLVSYDDVGRITDFGSVEVQGVYISGNLTKPFKQFMQDPDSRRDMDWTGQKNYPRPDYLSSSRKRLAPQMIYKGGILKAWGKKQVVVVHKNFYATLPELKPVEAGNEAKADLAWHLYYLQHDTSVDRYKLALERIVYTMFEPALEQITKAEAGPIETFIGKLQEKLDEKLKNGTGPTLRPWQTSWIGKKWPDRSAVQPRISCPFSRTITPTSAASLMSLKLRS